MTAFHPMTWSQWSHARPVVMFAGEQRKTAEGTSNVIGVYPATGTDPSGTLTPVCTIVVSCYAVQGVWTCTLSLACTCDTDWNSSSELDREVYLVH